MASVDAFGILLIDKPVGPTSHDVVHRVRQTTEVKKVGHTGTLDPMASGLLVLCLGPATRLSQYLTDQDKGYLAEVRFGVETDSHDALGEVVRDDGPVPPEKAVRAGLERFRGEIEQVPPAHSAIKIKGQRAYEIARAGQEPKLEPRRVEIYQLDLRDYEPPLAQLHIRCSSGTYIRALARDLGRILDSAAHLTKLKRTNVGSFNLDEALALDMFLESVEGGDWKKHMIPAAEALPDWPAIELAASALEDVRHGRPIDNETDRAGYARALNQEQELVAIMEADKESKTWRPRKVFLS